MAKKYKFVPYKIYNDGHIPVCFQGFNCPVNNKNWSVCYKCLSKNRISPICLLPIKKSSIFTKIKEFFKKWKKKIKNSILS